MLQLTIQLADQTEKSEGTDFVYANQMVNGVYDSEVAADRNSGKVVEENGYYMITESGR